MFAVANLISGLALIINMLLQIYMFILFGRVIISWVNGDPRNQIVQFLYRATEPMLYRFRRWFPWLARAGGLDFTPLLVIAMIYFLQVALVGSLNDLAISLKQ